MKTTICVICHSLNSIVVDYNGGIKVCVQCGTIYEENIIDNNNNEYMENQHEENDDDNDGINNWEHPEGHEQEGWIK